MKHLDPQNGINAWIVDLSAIHISQKQLLCISPNLFEHYIRIHVFDLQYDTYRNQDQAVYVGGTQVVSRMECKWDFELK